MSESDDELLTAKILYEKLWLAPVYDENGQLDTHDGLIAYTLTPAGLDALSKQSRREVTSEEYARAREMWNDVAPPLIPRPRQLRSGYSGGPSGAPPP
jgi:hypothetical protein